MSPFYPYFFAAARWLIAAVSVLLVFAWIRYFKGNKPTPPAIAMLTTRDGVSLPVTATENLIGRTARADILIPISGIAKRHALLYTVHNSWKIAPLDGAIQINLQNARKEAPLDYGDKITLAGQTLTFSRRTDEDISSRRPASPLLSLFLLSVFQLLVGTSISLRFWGSLSPLVPLCFLGLIAGEWIYFLIGRLIPHFTLLTELPICYLATLGLAVGCCTLPEDLPKQALCFAIGFVGFLLLTLLLKCHDFLLSMQRIVMLLSLALLYFTAFFGAKINNSRNWLQFGGFSVQPSELVKVAFVLCGAVSLYILFKKPIRRLEFLIYSLLAMGALALMLDFGAVAIFFVGMMMILTLRLEHPVLLGGIAGAAVLGGFGIILLYPYIARRFSAWLHAWEYADAGGYQQSRTMMSFASGGLLGVGGGNGHLHEIPAAENDLVFGIIGEEWGGIVALTAVLGLAALGFLAYRLMKNSTNMFNLITVGGAAVMVLFQSALNIFGSVDLLPLTGVTFVFVSRGGTSLIAAWLMMAFFKAAELHHKKPTEWRDSQ